jgi:hypothetical protein
VSESWNWQDDPIVEEPSWDWQNDPVVGTATKAPPQDPRLTAAYKDARKKLVGPKISKEAVHGSGMNWLGRALLGGSNIASEALGNDPHEATFNAATYLPVAGHYLNAKRNSDENEALERVAAGKGSENDYMLAGQALVRDELRKNKSGVQQVAEGLAAAPGFMAEMAVTGGVGRAGGLAAEAGVIQAGKGAAQRYVRKGAEFAGRALTQSAAQPMFMTNLAEADRATIEQYKDDLGQTQHLVQANNKSTVEKVLRAYGETLAETGGEMTGELIVAGMSKLGRFVPPAAAAAFSRVFNNWSKAHPNGTVNSFLKNIQDPFSEWTEERITENLSPLIGLGQDHGISGKLAAGDISGAIQDQLVEAAVIGPISGAAGMARADGQGPSQRHFQVVHGDVAGVIADFEREDDLSTLETLAAKEKPSRKDWVDAGMPPELTSKRQEFVDKLRGVLGGVPATPPPVVTTQPPQAPAAHPDRKPKRTLPVVPETAPQPPAAAQEPPTEETAPVIARPAPAPAGPSVAPQADIPPPAVKPSLTAFSDAKPPPSDEVLGDNGDAGVRANKEDAEEIRHKLSVLLDSPDLMAEYGVTEEQIASVVDMIPRAGGDFSVPAQVREVVAGEIRDHVIVLEDIAKDIPPGDPQKRLVQGQAKRLEKIADKIHREDASPEARPVQRVQAKPVLTRGSVARVFPVANITETQQGFRVEIGNSYLDIEHAPDVAADPVKDKQAVESYFRSRGRAVPKDLSELRAAGMYTVRTADGKVHDGIGIIKLAEGLADDATLRHEALHLAMRAGFLSKSEWERLKAQYASGIEHELDAEEAVARSREAWKGEATLWQKIQTWLRDLVAAMTGGRYDPRTAKDLMRMMDTPGFWQRQAAHPMSDEASQLRERDAYQMKWRLKSRDVIAEKMGGKAMPGAVLKMLENNGVKPEELEWTGLAEMLGGKNAPKMVTKEQVLAAIEQAPMIEEVVLGGGFDPLDRGTWPDAYTKEHDDIVSIRDRGGQISHNEAARKLDELDQKFSVSEPKFSQWQLPGEKKDYRELAITMPKKPGETYRVPAGHGMGSVEADENRLAHVRFNERTDADGKRVLFVEEIQSDWHQTGKKVGYQQPPLSPETKTDLDAARRRTFELLKQEDNLGFDIPQEALEAIRDNPDFAERWEMSPELIESATNYRRLSNLNAKAAAGVPDAPFKKTWPVLALKRMIQWAADNGFSKIAWTTGEQQAERHDLSKQVKEIVWSKHGGKEAGKYDLIVNGLGGDTIVKKGYQTPEQLEALVGKDMASRIVSEAEGKRPGETVRITGSGLKIGGDGMKGFYDQILPAEANKLIKKYGAKVGKTTIGSELDARKDDTGVAARPTNPPLVWEHPMPDEVGGNMWGADAGFNTRVIIRQDGEVFYLSINGQHAGTFQSLEDAQDGAELHLEEPGNAPEGWGSIGGDTLLPPTEVHSFDITDSMKLAALDLGQPMYQLKGRPEVANIGETQGTRDLFDDVQEEVKQDQAALGGRNYSSEMNDAEVTAEGLIRYKADPSGSEAAILQKSKIGQPLDPVETVVAKEIYRRLGVEAVTTGNPQAIERAQNLIRAWTRAGSAWSQSGRLRADPIQSPAERMQGEIARLLLEPPEHIQSQIAAAEKRYDQKAIDALNKAWAKKLLAIKEQLAAMGIDLDNLNQWGYNPIRADEVKRVIAPYKSTYAEMFREFFRFSTLSHPKTNIVNLTNSIATGLWHHSAEFLTEAALNKVAQRPEGAQIEEMKHAWSGMLPGLSSAMRHFMMTWRSETATFDRTIVDQPGEVAWMDYPRVSIPGSVGEALPARLRHTKFGDLARKVPLGRAIRAPQRFLLAADQAARAMLSYMEVGGRAYRMAKEEGLSGQEMAVRIAELTSDTASPAWRDAYKESLVLTGQQEGGKLAKGLKQGIFHARKTPYGIGEVFYYIAPYTTFAINSFETAVHKSPLGAIGTFNKMRQNLAKGDPILKGLTQQAAAQILSTAIMWAILGLNDEDEPFLTGAESSYDLDTRDQSRRIRRPPQSVKIGGKWHSYARFEPMATILSWMVDVSNGLKRGGPLDAVASLGKSTIGKINDQPFLQGIADVIEMVQAETKGNRPGEGFGRWASNFAVAWVPNIVRGAGRSMDDELQQRGVWGRGEEWWGNLANRTLQKTELAGQESYPVYDLWGRTIPNSTSFIPRTDMPYRLLVPSDNAMENIHAGDKLLLRWNEQHHEDRKFPSHPQRYHRVDGKAVYYTDKQYADLSKIAGLVTSKLIDQGSWSFESPTAAHIKELESLIESGRAIAKEAVLRGDTGSGDHAIAALAAEPMLKEMTASAPASLTKTLREQGYTTYDSAISDLNDRYDQIRSYLRDNDITEGEALSILDRLHAGLEPATRASRKGRFLSRMSR